MRIVGEVSQEYGPEDFSQCVITQIERTKISSLRIRVFYKAKNFCLEKVTMCLD